jgi:hypothetical protein
MSEHVPPIAEDISCDQAEGIQSEAKAKRKATDLESHKIPITFLKDESGSSMDVKSMTLPDLREVILSTEGVTKANLPRLKGARFGDKRSKNNSLRHDANVLGFDMIELDYDKEDMSFDQAVKRIKDMNVRALIYTTPSHTKVAPRWRVLMPVSRGDHELRMRRAFCSRVNGVLGNIFARESFVLSQSYYFGKALDNPNPNHRCEVIDGRFINLCDEFLKYQEKGGPKSAVRQASDSIDAAPAGRLKDVFRVRVASDQNRIAKALQEMPNGDNIEDWNDWNDMGLAVFGASDGSEIGFKAFDEWSKQSPKYDEQETRERWEHYKTSPPDRIGMGTLVYLARSFNPKFENEETDVDRLNRLHAVLPIGGKTRVVTFGEMPAFPGRETITMTQTIDDFKALKNRYRHEWVDKDGEIKSAPLGNHWIWSQERRQYDDGMAFMPHRAGDAGGKLNLWRGFGVRPVKPEPGSSAEAGCRKFLAFMRDIICSGNEEHFQYLLKREATIIQKRIRTEVALGLRTKEEGCGKGFYEATMRRLLGNHAMQVTNPEHIIGKFNPHLETLLRLTADEALFVGNHKHRNALFSLITEADLTIEPKNCGVYQADSFLNISITSNADHFLPVSGTARRFFIPTVSTTRMQDADYFNELKSDLEKGGFEALLYYFLNVDLADFNVRKVPQTAGLREQRDQSLEPLDAWWVELLDTGILTGCDPLHPNKAVSGEYQREIKTEVTYGDKTTTQIRHVRQLGLYDQARQIVPRLKGVSDVMLAKYLSERGCSNKDRVLRKRGWTFPPLLKCREDWTKRFPEWKWQNPQITAWSPEDGADAVAKDADPARHADWDTSKPLPKF